MKTKKMVTWAITEGNGLWFDGDFFGDFFVEKSKRIEYSDRIVALNAKENHLKNWKMAKLVKITREVVVKEKKSKTLLFQPGDIWEWVDSDRAAHYDQRVGWVVKVNHSELTNNVEVEVDMVGDSVIWDSDCTEGLKLIERDGKPV